MKINFSFILIFLLVTFTTNCQDLLINELMELKRGSLQQITNKFIGNGWIVSSVKEPGYKGSSIKEIVELDYLSSNSIESKLYLYLRKDQTISSFSWSFNSQYSYKNLLGSIRTLELDKEWIESESSGILNHFEKDEIHIELSVNSKEYSFMNYGKFTVILDNYFPELFKIIEPQSVIVQYKKDLKNRKLKEIALPNSNIYYSEVKLGAFVRELDEKNNKDKIPPNDEYSIIGPKGISIVVTNGEIVSINQRRKN